MFRTNLTTFLIALSSITYLSACSDGTTVKKDPVVSAAAPVTAQAGNFEGYYQLLMENDQEANRTEIIQIQKDGTIVHLAHPVEQKRKAITAVLTNPSDTVKGSMVADFKSLSVSDSQVQGGLPTLNHLELVYTNKENQMKLDYARITKEEADRLLLEDYLKRKALVSRLEGKYVLNKVEISQECEVNSAENSLPYGYGFFPNSSTIVYAPSAPYINNPDCQILLISPIEATSNLLASEKSTLLVIENLPEGVETMGIQLGVNRVITSFSLLKSATYQTNPDNLDQATLTILEEKTETTTKVQQSGHQFISDSQVLSYQPLDATDPLQIKIKEGEKAASTDEVPTLYLRQTATGPSGQLISATYTLKKEN